jgi:aconitate hydratase
MATQTANSFGARATLPVNGGAYFALPTLAKALSVSLDCLPFSMRILLENLLRNEDGRVVTRDDVAAMAAWQPAASDEREVPFLPARVLLQDFTGVPAVVDLAAMRDAMQRLGGDAKRINPQVPVDLVVDHSVQVDHYGSAAAFRLNSEIEFERNRERYMFLRWGQQSFQRFKVVPPETGIVHQVNLEYLASVVFRREDGVVFPDSVLGTDSHTTMINGIGVFGWGVGGIEAEAVMLGQPYYLLTPQVVGFELTGRLPAGATATDVVLTVTQMLRKKGVVGKFVEFFGPGLDGLALADRATIANMAPEYGATMGFFPVDDATLAYLRLSGRSDAQVQLVDAYCKAQGLFRTANTPAPKFSDTLSLDMGSVESSLAGPRRPQDRVALRDVKRSFFEAMTTAYKRPVTEKTAVKNPAPQGTRRDLYAAQAVTVSPNGNPFQLTHGSVVIAAITSCTNTSNPSVMLGAGLLARKAVEKGLTVRPWVKTSLAPGSKVVTDYLRAAGVLPSLETLGFHLVGYGCTTCIGNSGPLAPAIVDAVKKNDLVVAAVLSGNRNFEGRVNPATMANYLASPPLVVAFALAGTVDIDVETEPLGHGHNGAAVFLRDIWPTADEVEAAIRRVVSPEMFRAQYANVFSGDERWQGLPAPTTERYQWDPASTYIAEPPFFRGMTRMAANVHDISDARVLALLGDSVTTDHISPAGSIPVDGPAGKYLISRGVGAKDFNSYGARRGNHEVMMRGTFGNIRLRNRLVPDVEGGWTVHLPDKTKMTIYDAAMQYQREGTPLLVIAGQEYGTGSSRDWAAKGTLLLGVRAVLAESFERIHRSNLLGMGVLPLQFNPGENPTALGLTGTERYSISGLQQLTPRGHVAIQVQRDDGTRVELSAVVRLDSAIEVEYYRQGGILPAVLRNMLG